MRFIELALYYDSISIPVVLLISFSKRDFLHSLTVMAICVILIKRLMFINEELFETDLALHALLGIIMLRIVGYCRRVPFLQDDDSLTGFFYRKFGVEPVKWKWTKRIYGFLNGAVRYVDAISILLPPCAVMLIDKGGVDNLYVGVGAFLIIWGIFLLWIAIPLIALEAVVRASFSFMKSDQKKQVRQSVRHVRERGATNARLKARKVHAWLKAGFESDNKN